MIITAPICTRHITHRITMTDQESNISLLFKSIEAEFEAYERIDDPKRAEAKLSLLTSMIRDSKGYSSVLTCLKGVITELWTGSMVLIEMLVWFPHGHVSADPTYTSGSVRDKGSTLYSATTLRLSW